MEQTEIKNCCRHDLLLVSDSVTEHMDGEAGECWRKYPAVPLIYTRQEIWEDIPESDGSGMIRCGLSLPYKENGTRKRFAVYISPDAVLQVKTPFEVAEDLAGDNGRIGKLLEEIRKIPGIRAGIYGSAALEWVSGYRYLTDMSDVDLIIEGKSREALYGFYHMLPGLEHLCQTNLDLEARFPGGRDVKLREMFSAQDTVIVKSVDNVELTEAEDLWKLIG